MSLLNDEMRGKRVRLIRTTDPLSKLEPGAMGTAHFMIDGILYSTWDEGVRQPLIEHVDEWEYMEDENA
jgi:hypothetical protein